MEGGPPIFRQDGSCPALLEDPAQGFPYGAVTRCGAPFQTLPVPLDKTTGLFRVRSPLLTESRNAGANRHREPCQSRVLLMSLPPATEMFQFAGFASCTYEFSAGYPRGWVAPFGDPGITDRSHLPRAFRSVPRPSSPLSAKASTRCPFWRLIPASCRGTRSAAKRRAKPPRTGPNPSHAGRAATPRRPRIKTLRRTRPAGSPATRVRLGHTNSLFTRSINPPRPAPMVPRWWR